MKKAVIATGGKQYLVSEGEILEVEYLGNDKKTIQIDPLLVINEKDILVGAPTVDGAKVDVKILEELKADKVIAIRYKPKKRVRKIRGHRQRLSKISIEKIEYK